MSTIDSALLSLGSIISKDIVVEHSGMESARAHRFSRRLSWGLIALMATLAILLPQTIWALLVLKLELLLQVAPLIILGVRYQRLDTQALLVGLLAGALTCSAMKLVPAWDMPLGVHAGVWALGVNQFCCGI